MGKLIIRNGSPRSQKSNSKCYGEIFSKYYKDDIVTFNVKKITILKFVIR